jgi:hypothetical protein
MELMFGCRRVGGCCDIPKGVERTPTPHVRGVEAGNKCHSERGAGRHLFGREAGQDHA